MRREKNVGGRYGSMNYGIGALFKKTGVVLFLFLAFGAFAFWAPGASAESGFYTTSCAPCHGASPNTCNGCHAHGIHSNRSKNNINLVATTNKSTYAPGEAMTVTLAGGYRNGWVRALLRDGTGVIVSRSTPPGSTGGVTTSVLPYTFTVTPTGTTLTAPTTPGTYTYTAAWYGNKYDLAERGGTTFFGPNWTPDSTNPNHGEERVSTTFTVVAAAPTLSSIAVTGAASVNEGSTAQYTATATWSDSSTTNVTDRKSVV